MHWLSIGAVYKQYKMIFVEIACTRITLQLVEAVQTT